MEIMLAITLMAILLASFALYSQTSHLRTDINSQADIMVSYLKLAQSNAASGKVDTFNAIHLDTVANSYTLFEGSSYNAVDPTNFEIELPESISLQNISLNGGGSSIIFLSPDGGTSTYGSFELNSAQINKSINITISSIGKIES